MTSSTENKPPSRYTPARRIAAFIGVVLLLLLGASSFLVAVFGGEAYTDLVGRLLIVSVFAPIAIWLFVWAVGVFPFFGQKKNNNSTWKGETMEQEKKISTGAIRTVVFDIGGVLVGFDFKEFIAGKGCDEAKTERIIADTVKSPWWKEYDRGYMTDDEIMDKFCEGDPEMADEIRRIFADIHGMLNRREESIPWIHALKAAGYQVLVLSNYSQRALDGCPEANDFLSEVDGGILSFRDHLIKPDPAIYQLLVTRYDLTPEETVFIDDTPVNIDAAIEQGWKGIVWHDRAQVEEELHALGVNW